MAERTVPHAYPMSAEYEFANPSKIYDQNFGEGKKNDWLVAFPFDLHTVDCKQSKAELVILTQRLRESYGRVIMKQRITHTHFAIVEMFS